MMNAFRRDNGEVKYIPLVILEIFFFLLSGGFVCAVGKFEWSSPATASVVFIVVVCGLVSDNFVALVFVAEELLQSDDGTDDQGDLGNDESLEGEEGKSTESDGDQSCGLQFQEKEDGEEGFSDFLLFATSWNEFENLVRCFAFKNLIKN